MKKLLMILGLAFVTPTYSMANMDSGLYDPLPPEGSAFVRFVNAAGEKGSEQTSANGKGYVYLEHKETSPYFVMEEKETELGFGAMKSNFTPAAGKFYTVVWRDDLNIIEDDQNDNRAKSQILFYNLSNHDKLSLKTKDGKVAIVKDVVKGAVSSRQINPVKVDLAVYKGDEKIMDLDSLSMERGMAYGAFIYADDSATWVRSTTNTVR